MLWFIQIVIQVLALKKRDIFWHLTKVGRCLHVHEVHVSFFLSMPLSVKFNNDHIGRFLVWHINYKGKNLSLSVGFVVFPFKCTI